VLLLSALSFATYRNVEGVILSREYEASRRVIQTTSATISEMDALSRRVAASVYMNRDAQWLMGESRGSGLYEILTRLDRLDSLRVYNPMITSILVYSGETNTTFDTRRLIHTGRNPFILDGVPLPRLRPVYQVTRHATSDFYVDEQVRHFAYTNYVGDAEYVDWGIIVQIDADWLISAVQRIGNADEAYRLFLFGGDGELLFGEEDLAAAVDPDSLSDATADEGYLVSRIAEEESLIVYSSLDESDWFVVLTRPVDEITGYVAAVRKSIMILTVVFALVAGICAIGLSLFIYRPISNLVSLVGPADESGIWTDEFDFISHRLTAIQIGQDVDRQTAQSYQLYRLLLDSPRIAAGDRAALDLPIDLSRPITVAVARIDDQSREVTEASHTAVRGAMFEIAARGENRAFIFAGAHRYVLLANTAGAASPSVLLEALVAAQRALWNQHGVSVSISVGETVCDLRRLSAEYNATVSQLRYAFLFGHRSLITPDRIAELDTVAFTDVRRVDLERNLLKSITQGDAREAARVLAEIVRHYSSLNIDALVLALTVLTSRVRETMQTINDRRLEPSTINFDELSDLARTAPTLRSFEERLVAIISEFVPSGSTTADPRHSVIVAHLLEAIQSSFANPNLALKSLAADLGMSSSYVGHLFKERVGESFADYLKAYRIDTAASLFKRDADRSVRDVMHEVGFDNESYFYRMFKTRFGVTPREYVLKTAVIAARSTDRIIDHNQDLAR